MVNSWQVLQHLSHFHSGTLYMYMFVLVVASLYVRVYVCVSESILIIMSCSCTFCIMCSHLQFCKLRIQCTIVYIFVHGTCMYCTCTYMYVYYVLSPGCGL